MPSHVLIGSGVVPELTALKLRGVQTDAYGEIKGGHKALFDTEQTGETGTLAAGSKIENLVLGGDQLSVSQGGFSTTLEDSKGIEFSNSNNNVEWIDLPSVFDLFSLGEEPSFVLSLWITNKTVSGTGSPAIIGYAYQTTTYCQWSLSHDNADNTLALRFSGLKAATVVPINEPVLLTIYVLRTGPGTYKIDFYNGDQLIASHSNKLYPFNDPGGPGVASTRRIGMIGGQTQTWNGIVHRLQLFKVDPETFDIDQWLADEIANNSDRFVLP